MFKSQMKYQKILCLVCLILAALLFVYALGFITSLYDMLYFTSEMDKSSGEVKNQKVDGVDWFWELETVVIKRQEIVTDQYGNEDEVNIVERRVGFVDQMVTVAIIDIALALLMYITRNNKRRLYYVGNYVSTGLFSAYNLGIAAWIMARISYFNGNYQAINQEQLQAYCENWNIQYNYNGPITSFNLGYALCAILILAAIAVVLNLIWKIRLQKRENKLLNQSSVQEVAVNG